MTNPSTPHAVDQQYISAALLNVVLMTREASLDEIQAHLANSFGDRLGEFQASDSGLLSVELDEEHLISITVLDGPPTDPNEAYSLHPVLTGDPSALEDVQAQVLITAFPSNAALENVRSNREDRMVQIILHAQITAAIAALDGVAAIHNLMGNVTTAPKTYVEAVTNGDHAMYSASVWLTQTDSGITAYTVGMVRAGHPELVAENSASDPSTLFYAMLDLANYALSGATLKDGDTFAFSANAESLTIQDTVYPSDSSIPAVRVSL